MKREELLQKAKPILFNTEMVQAILEGRKTVTRRIIKPQPTYSPHDGFNWKGGAYGLSIPPTIEGAAHNFLCAAQYKVGNILYIRETWHKYKKRVGKGEGCHIATFYGYRASIANSEDANERWKPSIHMPKEAARIFLRITNVRAERLQDITPDEIEKEGILNHCKGCHATFGCDDCMNDTPIEEEWKILWDSTISKPDLYKYGWDANPWVWVYEFERVEAE